MRSSCPILILVGLGLTAYSKPVNQAKVYRDYVQAIPKNNSWGSGEVDSGVYVSKVIAVDKTKRDGYVACLKQRELPKWQRMKQDGLLADLSVFEVTSADSEPGVPVWNFTLLSHLTTSHDVAEFHQREKRQSGKTCEEEVNAEVRRVETLRPTPNSNYPRTTAEDTREARNLKIKYIIEYIAVHDTPTDLNDYRESMRINTGPAVGTILIPDKLKFSLTALETVSVEYSQSGMPKWNQIHVNGNYEPDPITTAAIDSALRRVNPNNGGVEGVFGHLNTIRTKPREDEVNLLYELAVR